MKKVSAGEGEKKTYIYRGEKTDVDSAHTKKMF